MEMNLPVLTVLMPDFYTYLPVGGTACPMGRIVYMLPTVVHKFYKLINYILHTYTIRSNDTTNATIWHPYTDSLVIMKK